jgi:site-specific DNA-methyltransferase (adenine-specific)
MRLHHGDESVTLWHGDCIDVLRQLADCSVDAVVTDPPYGLEFMGKDWDAPWKASSVGRGVRVEAERADEMTKAGKGHATSAGPYLAARVDSVRVAGLPFQQWCTEWATECLRVLKPGGHILAFGGSRTWHRLASAIEDAGFEIRDSIAWLYGSGFPKSLDVSKAIEKAAGAEREVIDSFTKSGDIKGGSLHSGAPSSGIGHRTVVDITAPATPDAERWQGWGTALKPAFEPVVVGRKPLAGTVSQNVLTHSTGALNIDGCRIKTTDDLNGGAYAKVGNRSESASLHAGSGMNVPGATTGKEYVAPAGRWPANVILDESQADALDQQSGTQRDGVATNRNRDASELASDAGWGFRKQQADVGYGGSGGASRFFYVAKAPKSERPRTDDGTAHPTVKPLALMRWLVRLVTPPGGTVLEPFAGSGTTVEACLFEGFHCIAIEREADYLPLIEARIQRASRKPKPEPDLFSFDDEEASA